MTQFNALNIPQSLPRTEQIGTAPNRRKRRGLAAAFAVGAVLTSAACGDLTSDNAPQQPDSLCITALTPADAIAAVQSLPPGTITQGINQGNGVQDICVIQDGVAQYYSPDDNFNGYLMYAELTNVVQGFSDDEIINGGLAPYQSIALADSVMVHGNGEEYPAFAFSSGEYNRQTYRSGIARAFIRNAQFGNGKRVPFGTQVRGYGITSLKPANPQTIALTTSSGSVRRSTITQVAHTGLPPVTKTSKSTPYIAPLRSRKTGGH